MNLRTIFPNGKGNYQSPYDFTAAYSTSTKITLSGLPDTLTISQATQIKQVLVIASGNTSAIYRNGENGVTFSYASGEVTIYGAGTPFASGDKYEVSIDGDKKGWLSTIGTFKNFIVNSLERIETPYEPLATTQTLTSSYVDVGDEIDMEYCTHLTAYFDMDVNDSEDVDVQVVARYKSGGTDYNLVDGVQRLWSGAGSDDNDAYSFDADGAPYLQMQVKAGTVGSTPGTITVNITKKWRN